MTNINVLFGWDYLKKGKIFLIPEANKIAVKKNRRRIDVPKGVDREKSNLNRCYPGNKKGLPMEREAFEITQLTRKQGVDLLLDLHESRRLHLTVKDKQGNYSGLGQTLFYTPNEEATWLGMVVLDQLNPSIEVEKNRFSMVERPIKHSAAWSAGNILNISGFTIETYRGLPLEDRIDYQIKIVTIMLKEKGMI